jgi:hypothetical protein
VKTKKLTYFYCPIKNQYSSNQKTIHAYRSIYSTLDRFTVTQQSKTKTNIQPPQKPFGE